MRIVTILLLATAHLCAASGSLTGRLTDPQGAPVARGRVRVAPLRAAETTPDSDGDYRFAELPAGTYQVIATAPGFVEARRTVSLGDGQTLTVNSTLALGGRADAITVTADVKSVDVQNPDPAQRVMVRDEILDANPGRPGAPVSIPGLPIETASSGIKAPQYFAPGVAGDHGEPIATFIQVGSFLLPNNLSANAHGNGYSDPNIIVPALIESVQTDGGAFNVREGNHSVDLSAT